MSNVIRYGSNNGASNNDYVDSQISGVLNTLNTRITPIEVFNANILNTVTLNKTSTDTSITALQTNVNNNNTNITVLQTSVDSNSVDISTLFKESYMTRAEYMTNTCINKSIYAGSGQIVYGPYRDIYISNDMWTRKNVINTGLSGSLNIGYPTYGYTKELGTMNTPKFLINGNIIKLHSTNWNDSSIGVGASINLPDASRNNIVPVISDSTSLPAMKQGDMAILTDLTRELVNGNFVDSGSTIIDYTSGMTITNGVTYTSGVWAGVIDSSLYLIKDVKYVLTVDVVSISTFYGLYVSIDYDKPLFSYINTIGQHVIEFIAEKTGEVTFGLYIRFDSQTQSGDNIVLSAIPSIKQVYETPIVALTDISVNTDLHTVSYGIEKRDRISRQDFVGLEVCHEDIFTKRVVYPLGNTQYSGSDTNTLTGITYGVFPGKETYSLFGNWQEDNALIGKCYVWDDLSIDDKNKFINDKYNNIYKDGDKIIQVRYRIRVIKGLGNDWFNVNTINTNEELSYKNNYSSIKPKGEDISIAFDLAGDRHTHSYSLPGQLTGWFCNKSYASTAVSDLELGVWNTYKFGSIQAYNNELYMLPIALVQRRNIGIWDESWNPDGCSKVYVAGVAMSSDVAPIGTITSMADCFDPTKIATINVNTPSIAHTYDKLLDGTDDSTVYKLTGTVPSSVSGRPDGLYVDEISNNDVNDLRDNANKIINEETYLNEMYNKIINGDIRGEEGTYELAPIVTNGSFKIPFRFETGLSIGDVILLYTSDNPSVISNITHIVYNIGDTIVLIEETGKYCIGNVISKQNDEESITFEITDTTLTLTDFTYMYDKYYKPKTIISTLTKSEYKSNYDMLHCDIVGDIRQLKDRAKLTITTTNSVINIIKGTYILASSVTNNGGVINHYYLYIGRTDLSNINTNNTTGIANTDSGYILLSDTTMWTDLGTDGTVGGYPSHWATQGVTGMPLLKDKQGISLLPMDIPYYGTHNSFYLKLYKKVKDILRVVVDGVEYTSNRDPSTMGAGDAAYYMGISTGSNEYLFSTLDNSIAFSYDDINSNSIIKIYYKVRANFTELTDNERVISLGHNHVIAAINNNDSYVITLYPMLMNKVGTRPASSYKGHQSGIHLRHTPVKTYENNQLSGESSADLIPEHDPISLDTGYCSPAMKMFPYLTMSNERAKMNLVFKEMVYDDAVMNQDGTPTYTWGDDNKFQIRSNIGITIDNNGNEILFGQKSVKLNRYLNIRDK